MTVSPPDLVLCGRDIIIFSIRSQTMHLCSTCTLNLCVHLLLRGSPSIICPCSHAPKRSLIYLSTMIPPSISQPSLHLHPPYSAHVVPQQNTAS